MTKSILANDRSTSRTQDAAEPRATIWGLSARELHDAFWRSRGVLCVRPGERMPLDRTADLYLLLEPSQLVLFNLGEMMDHLMWRAAAVTRLRLTKEASSPYRERIETDADGYVTRIKRFYDPVDHGSARLFITGRSDLAERWMNADNARHGWAAIRRRTNLSRIDRRRIMGKRFILGQATEEHDFVQELLSQWPDPDIAIDGIDQASDGVWHFAGDGPVQQARLIGPLWIGLGQQLSQNQCMVGPAWLPDRDPPNGSSATIREIVDIERAGTNRPLPRAQSRSLYHLFKRAFDVAFSLTVLVVLSPLFLLIAVAIVIDNGFPVFFRHKRQSRGGMLFDCVKFRTMRRNADKMVVELQSRNRCDGPQVNIENDPRVTTVGRVLRHLNLDELPQFWNVLRGHMSIVGPRPSPENENQFCPAWRELRLSVRPGITGLWQLKRTRSPGQDFQEWIRYDIEYVRQASFWLDLVICMQTARMMLFGRSDHDSQ